MMIKRRVCLILDPVEAVINDLISKKIVTLTSIDSPIRVFRLNKHKTGYTVYFYNKRYTVEAIQCFNDPTRYLLDFEYPLNSHFLHQKNINNLYLDFYGTRISIGHQCHE